MPDPTELNHRDRSFGLIVAGTAQIAIGLLCAGLVPLTLAGAAMSPALDLLTVAPSMALYAVAAAIFLVLGVGSIRARRWARALSLSLSWLWLITGICTVLLVWSAFPSLWHELAAAAGIDDRTARMVAIGINLVLGVVWVLLPGAFVIFFRSPDVVATCRERDPDPGWVGRSPQRLLALAAAYVLCALSLAAMPSYGFVFPLFGLVLSGAAGALCWAAVFALCLALAWGTLRGELWAWRTAMTGCVLAALSWVTTSALVEPPEILDAMSLPPEQRVIMELIWPAEAWIHVAGWLVIWGSLAVYLFTVRGLFQKGGRPERG